MSNLTATTSANPQIAARLRDCDENKAETRVNFSPPRCFHLCAECLLL